MRHRAFALRPVASLVAAAALLAACGGGGDGGIAPPIDCSTTAQKDWLRSYMADRYFWYRLSLSPSPAGYATVDAYFDALLYGGGDLIPAPNPTNARWPVDRYSGFQSTESFNRFFGAGQTLGFGVMVNGIEAVDQGATRLFIRYIEPQSPAARSSGVAGGLARGDEILAINGTPAAQVIAADDFAALSPNNSGDTLRLDIRRASGLTASVTLVAAIYSLAPVQNGRVVFSQGNRRIGYVFVKDMIEQVGMPLAQTMADFRAQGVQDIVLDLRYNGGGLVSAAANVASYIGGGAGSGKVFTRLLYNDRNTALNETFRFANPNQWAGFGRVYVLMGERTCSASEQVINGLRGIGVNVVGVGGTSCGKPVGFLPQDNACGTTYSVVNFESVNANGEGRYFDGLQATCAVAEDFAQPIGALADPLLVAAAHHADNGACPAGTGIREQPQSRRSAARRPYRGADGAEGGGGMLGR